MTDVSHISSSVFTVGGETTGGKLLIPSTTIAGHDIYCVVASKGHTATTAYPTVTDTDSGGNTFTIIGTTGSRKGTLYWKKATSGTAGKLVTVSGAFQACAGVLSVHSGGFADVDPTTDFAAETNNVGSNSQAAFTPSYASSMICLAVVQYNGSTSCSTLSCTNPGILAKRAEYQSTAGAAAVLGSSFQTVPLVTTGTLQWTQASNLTNVSMAWAIRPSIITPSSVTAPVSTATMPIHTYGAAGTYVVKLTVTDNDGNSSSTTKAVTVS